MLRKQYTDSGASHNSHFTTQINENSAALTNKYIFNYINNIKGIANTHTSTSRHLCRKFLTPTKIFPRTLLFIHKLFLPLHSQTERDVAQPG